MKIALPSRISRAVRSRPLARVGFVDASAVIRRDQRFSVATKSQGLSVDFFSSFLIVPSGDSVTDFSFFSTVPSLLTFSLSVLERVRSHPVVRNDNARAEVAVHSMNLLVFMFRLSLLRMFFRIEDKLEVEEVHRHGAKPAARPPCAARRALGQNTRGDEHSAGAILAGTARLAGWRKTGGYPSRFFSFPWHAQLLEVDHCNLSLRSSLLVVAFLERQASKR